jgi:Na+-driven multidrug efflux pump
LANLFLGIYVNLSIWYKLTDRTLMGAFVSLAGSALTIGLNVWWIPKFGYVGSAWATLACYASMAIVSYLLGRRYYPVAYDVKRSDRLYSTGCRFVLCAGAVTGKRWLVATVVIVHRIDAAIYSDGCAF